MNASHATRDAHSTYIEMLELLGGSAEDGPPPDEADRFAGVMGIKRKPGFSAPLIMSDEDRESYIRRVLAEHLAQRPDMAASFRRNSCTRLKVRFPRTLYNEIGAAAHADGTSMNTFVLTACAAYLGRGTHVQTSVGEVADARPRV